MNLITSIYSYNELQQANPDFQNVNKPINHKRTYIKNAPDNMKILSL